MKKIMVLMTAVMLLAACGQSYEEKQRITRQQRLKMLREDSAALKVAVLPTMDCLPLLVASERGFFKDLGVDIRLKHYTAQMDCDTAVERGRVEGVVSDLVRTERLRQRGTELRYVAATNAYWQLIANRKARIREMKHLEDKMIAMTRHSATDLLCDAVVDSTKLKAEHVFRVQVNDVNIRLGMLLGNEMDAMLLTEPQATVARQQKHEVLLDSRRMDLNLGVVAFRESVLADTARQRQMDAFLKAYDRACDSLNRYGVGPYMPIVERWLSAGAGGARADKGLLNMKFPRAAAPRQQDIDRAAKWWAAVVANKNSAAK